VHEVQIFNIVIANIESQTAKKWNRCLFGTSYWRLKSNVGRRCRSIYCTSSTILQSPSYITLDNQWFFSISNLSEYSVKRHKACPVCEEETLSIQLKHGRKKVPWYPEILAHIPLLSKDSESVWWSSKDIEQWTYISTGEISHYKLWKREVKYSWKECEEEAINIFLIFRIEKFYLWDTVLMSCILRRMSVIVLLAHYSIYLVRLWTQSNLDWIWLKCIYVSSSHHRRGGKIYIYRQHAILCLKRRR